MFRLREFFANCRPHLYERVSAESLAVLRIAFGFLMAIDCWNERGLTVAEQRWGDIDQCHFPLFETIKPMPLKWMRILYYVMLGGESN